MPSFANDSLGVDIIELKKAKDFYHRHKKRLGSFFRPAEVRYIQSKGPNPHVRLAEVLAAKEAFFKSRGEYWMGLSGFKGIRFEASRFSWIRTGRYVVAQFKKAGQ